ncbi:MAG TPA: hypothetical protein P5266_07070, partial [Candidatus Fermentibacter sp.]|nr:hypothetical protein [Candidatus Fermentibacter sp.]
GPFRTGGGAMIAEIVSRNELPMPSDPAVLAPMYLGVQTGHGSLAVLSLLDILREDASVEDLRAEFEQALRESRNSQEPEPALPAGY